MGLHQDWGGPLLDHFVCCLATLLLPIKQRDEFLVSLSVPVTTSGEGERQRWTFVEDDLEEVHNPNKCTPITVKPLNKGHLGDNKVSFIRRYY